MFRRFSRGFLSLTGTAAVALSLSACGVHWDYGHPILPEISAADAQLQELVAKEMRFAQAAQQVRDCAACQPILEQFVAGAKARQEALGGVWEPWPQGVPQGAPLPPGANLPAYATSAGQLSEQLVADGFASLRQVPQLEAASDRQLVAAVAVTRIHTGIRLAQANGSWESLLAKLAADSQFATATEVFPEAATQASFALRDWDCALQSLPVLTAELPVAEEKLWRPRVRQLTLQLEQNISVALASQVSDVRVNSCVGAFEQSAGDAGAASVFSRVYEQLLVSTALGLAENPQAGKATYAPLPQGSFLYGALVQLVADNQFELTQPLPGVVKTD